MNKNNARLLLASDYFVSDTLPQVVMNGELERETQRKMQELYPGQEYRALVEDLPKSGTSRHLLVRVISAGEVLPETIATQKRLGL